MSPPAPPRVALVTGAARRLGREVAVTLARAGWDVAVHYAASEGDAEHTVGLVQAEGRRAVAVRARLDQEDEVVGLLPRVAEALGPVHALVNNASRFEHDDAGTFSYAALAAHVGPNLAAPVLLTRELHRLLPAEAPEGVAVMLLDQKLYGLNPDFFSYTLTKAALAAATTMLAQALAPRVRVVGVAPGLTLPSYLQSDDAFARAHANFSPLGRSSTPEDVAASVLFAVTNRSLTGSVILCDGGQHLHPLPRDVSFLPDAQN